MHPLNYRTKNMDTFLELPHENQSEVGGSRKPEQMHSKEIKIAT